jgi:hypothetical protein
MALKSCTLHRLSYNDELDPTCPQCMLAGVFVPGSQVDAKAGEHGAPVPPDVLQRALAAIAAREG